MDSDYYAAIVRRVALALLGLLIAVGPAMAANIGKWNTPDGATTILSTELNGLANNTLTASSSTYNNSANLNLYCDAEISVGPFSPASGGYFTVYILPSLDGTNFPKSIGSVLRNQPYHAWFTVALDTTASESQRNVVRNLLLPPEAVKFALDNQSGVGTPGTGNTFKINCYNINNNG